MAGLTTPTHAIHRVANVQVLAEAVACIWWHFHQFLKAIVSYMYTQMTIKPILGTRQQHRSDGPELVTHALSTRTVSLVHVPIEDEIRSGDGNVSAGFSERLYSLLY